MFGWIVRRQFAGLERRWGVSLEYLRHMQRTSPGGLYRFLAMMPVAGYRRRLSAEAAEVARIVATRYQDCGTCVQIAVAQAREDRVDSRLIRAAVDGTPEQLPELLADVYHYAVAVAERQDEPELREKLRRQLGEAALVELALAVATTQVFPTIKRALGYATSCARVKVEV